MTATAPTTSPPTAERTASARPRRLSPQRLIGTHGLLVLLVVLVIAFSLALPDTFPTAFNARTILADKAAVGFIALAVMVPMTAGQFDLSVGYLLGLTHILAVGLQVRAGLPWPLVVVVVLAVGALVGLVNGLLVEVAKIHSFIATLGMGTILFGVSNWYTQGQQVTGRLSTAFLRLTATEVAGIPIAALYVAAVALVLWVAYEFLPVGRRMYALGANPRAAALTGISARRYTTGAFMLSGVLAACAGVLVASKLQVGQANIGPEFMLPGFVGAFLGSTSVRPGRANVWGTVLAVLVLAVGISGLEQLGQAFFVEPLFNGGTLVLAVGLSGFAQRRRIRATAATAARAASAPPASESSAVEPSPSATPTGSS
ncbi:ABC transporter permease [Streptomyces sparsogenes]|uniref:ABC transporter permease n=1 Tax=Streptomyces cuspidosporus TaxID=66882 RepID=A0ABN3FJV8_9ACTN